MITLISYGLGNITAFANVFKRLDIPVRIATTRSDLEHADKLILPGVGAFDYAMERFCESGLRETIDELVLNRKVPILGICVGMQMLAKSSEEGILPGLGYIDGVVKKFNPDLIQIKPKLPHMGWNNVSFISGENIFTGIDNESIFYFLHSYYFVCNDLADVIATTHYGMDFHAAIKHENVYGVQFHPEKSHHNGTLLLKNYSEVQCAQA